MNAIINQSAEVGEKAAQPPYQYIGSIILSGGTAEEHNLVSRFAEEVWFNFADDDTALSFKPTMNEVVFWVSAKTQKRVNDVLDEAIKTLERAFKKKGLALHYGEKVQHDAQGVREKALKKLTAEERRVLGLD